MDQFTKEEQRDTKTNWWSVFQSEKNRLGTGMLDTFLGPRGRGKTAMASMLVGCECWRNTEPLYATAMELAADIRKSFEDHSDRRRRFERCSLLVIDEFHRADKTDWAERLMESLLDHRYRYKRDTIIIGNDSPEDFVKHCGSSVASRIKECGKIVILDGEDFRLIGDKHE
jgi:DNA replication protein DnaC